MRALVTCVLMLLVGCPGSLKYPQLDSGTGNNDFPIYPDLGGTGDLNLVDGVTSKPDGTQTRPDGAQTKPDGPQVIKPDGPLTKPDLKLVGDLGSWPCAAGGSAVQTYTSAMKICTYPTSFTQCAATSRCTSGWHLCTASEFRAGGGDQKVGLHNAWLASCSRINGQNQAPTNTVCASCNFATTGSTSTYQWRCDNMGTSASSAAYVALSSSSTCYKVGVNSTANAAYWRGRSAYTSLSAVVCCK